MPDWTDTLAARQRGEHAEFFDVNRPLEEQGNAGRIAAGLAPEPELVADEPDAPDELVTTRARPARKAAKAAGSRKR